MVDNHGDRFRPLSVGRFTVYPPFHTPLRYPKDRFLPILQGSDPRVPIVTQKKSWKASESWIDRVLNLLLTLLMILFRIGMFPKIGGKHQNGWCIMENPIKMDDLGGKPTIFGNIHIDIQKMIAMYTIIAHWLPSAVVVLEWVKRVLQKHRT